MEGIDIILVYYLDKIKVIIYLNFSKKNISIIEALQVLDFCFPV